MVLNEGSLVFDDGCWEGGCEGGGGGNGGGTSTGTMPEPTIRNDFIVGTTGMDTIHLLDGNDY